MPKHYNDCNTQERYERMMQAYELLKDNVANESALYNIKAILRDIKDDSDINEVSVGMLRREIAICNATRGYEDFCPLDEVTALLD